jgi:hypothetical protein
VYLRDVVAGDRVQILRCSRVPDPPSQFQGRSTFDQQQWRAGSIGQPCRELRDDEDGYVLLQSPEVETFAFGGLNEPISQCAQVRRRRGVRRAHAEARRVGVGR